MQTTSRLESAAFYVFLATIVVSPLAFLPVSYISTDLVKTLVISLGTLISAILYCIVSVKERRIVLPPKSMLFTSLIVAASVLVSSFTGVHIGKSLFGQGFEIGTASFILVGFLAAQTAYAAVRKSSERAIVIYLGMAAPFVILWLFHALRFIFGSGFLSFSILNSLTSSISGQWYSLSIYAILMLIVSVSALLFLPVSGRFRAWYWSIIILSLAAAFVINSSQSWLAGGAAMALFTLWMFFSRPVPEGNIIKRITGRISWVPLAACIVMFVMSFYGSDIAGPAIRAAGGGYSELSLPWPLTLDITADAVKARPLFGVGPNHFTQAFLAYKPPAINTTDAWSAEFNYGFGLIPTFVSTQGLFGLLSWVLFLIFFGILGVRALRQDSRGPSADFALASAFFGAAFLWIAAVLYVPSHAMLLYAFIMTGVFLGTSVENGLLLGFSVDPLPGTRGRALLVPSLLISIIVLGLWSAISVKKAAAMAYFGAGVKELSVSGDAQAADIDFERALTIDSSDVYWQARAEAGMVKASAMASAISSLSSGTAASTTRVLADRLSQTVNDALSYARDAIAYDPSNYYNFISEARVSELASSLRMESAFDNGLQAYKSAVTLNPLNPSLYLSIARFQASNNKLDDALRTVGAALQVKNDYIDAIFMLSQIQAARGNLADAITAAKVGTQVNPGSPLLFFQLGLLEYNNKDYSAAAAALVQAVNIQPDYANAKYFLGLSYSRLGKNPEAIAEFEALSKANPDSREVSLILSNLRAGRSPFTDAAPPVTPNPEKRPSLPLKEKR